MKWLIIGLTSFLLIFATNGFVIASSKTNGLAITSSKGKLNASVLVTPPRQGVKISHIPLIVSDALIDIISAVINSPQKQHFRRLSSLSPSRSVVDLDAEFPSGVVREIQSDHLSPSRSVKSKSSTHSAVDLDAEFPGGVVREIQSDHLSPSHSVKSKSSTHSAVDLDAEFPSGVVREIQSDHLSPSRSVKSKSTTHSAVDLDAEFPGGVVREIQSDHLSPSHSVKSKSSTHSAVDLDAEFPSGVVREIQSDHLSPSRSVKSKSSTHSAVDLDAEFPGGVVREIQSDHLSPSHSVKSKSSTHSAVDLDAEFPGGVVREIQSDHLSPSRSVKSKSTTHSAVDLDAEFPNNGAKEVPSYNDYASLTSKISQSKTSISSYNSDQMVLRNDPILILQRRLQDGLIKFAMEKGIYDKESKPFEKAQLSVEERQQMLQRLDKIHSDFLTVQSSSRQIKQSADSILRNIKESFIERLHVKDLELERRLKTKLTTLARDKGFDSFDGVSLPLIDTNGKLSNSRMVILNALDQVFFDFLEEKEDNYTSKNKIDAAILLAHIKNVDFLNLLQPTPDTSNIDELMGQDLIGAVTEEESINKEPVSSIALSLNPVSGGKNLGLSSDIETLPQLAVQNPLITSKVIGIGSELPAVEGVETVRKDVGVDYAIGSILLVGKPLDSSVPDVVTGGSKPLVVNDNEALRVLGNGKVLTDSVSDIVSIAASPKFNNAIIVRPVSSGKNLGLSSDVETLPQLAVQNPLITSKVIGIGSELPAVEGVETVRKDVGVDYAIGSILLAGKPLDSSVPDVVTGGSKPLVINDNEASRVLGNGKVLTDSVSDIVSIAASPKFNNAIIVRPISSGKNLGLSSDVETLPQLAVQNPLITSKVIGIGSELPAVEGVETVRKDVGVDYAIGSILLAGKPLDSSVPDVVTGGSKPLVINDNEASRVLGNGKVLTDSVSDIVSIAASPKFNNAIIVRPVSSGKNLGLSSDVETLPQLAVQNPLITSKVIGIGSELPAVEGVETVRKDVGVDYAIGSILLAGKPLDSSVPDVITGGSKPLVINDNEASRVLGNGKVLTDSVSDIVSIAASPKFNNAIIVRPVSSGKNLGLSSNVETLPDVVAEVSEPLTKETELLINDILDSEGSNEIKKDLIKELIAHHEKIKLKKAKGQEVILAVKQNPEKTAELLSEVDFDFDESLQDPNNTNESSSTSSMNKAARYLSAMQNLESGEIEQEISHFKQRANLITLEISNILFSSVFTQIENRMLMVGVAAGEEVKKINKSVWISGFYGSAKQGSSSNIDAYRFNTGGVTIGADINLGENEANLIGLAYGKARSKFKMTQTRGDKFNVNHDIFSIYGQSEITNRLLLQGAVSYVKGKVTNKSVKLVGADRYETATGKFNTKGYNIRSQLSYKFNLDKFVLTPSIGFKYGKITEGAYDETGNDVFNLSVISKSRKILSGIAGIKASMPQVIAENINFEPSLNSSVEKILQDKVKQGKVKLQWADREFENDTNTSKLPKLAYNIGGSVLVKRNNTEIEASYNCHLKKKYVGHQGTLKLKLLF